MNRYMFYCSTNYHFIILYNIMQSINRYMFYCSTNYHFVLLYNIMQSMNQYMTLNNNLYSINNMLYNG